MKRLLSLFIVLFGAICTHSLPHGQLLLLPPELIQQSLHSPLRERVLLYPNNLIPQVPAYYDRSGLVHLKNLPEVPSYVDRVYPQNAPAQDVQPPVENKVDPAQQQPVPVPEERPDQNRDNSRGDVEGNGGENMSRIEFEPDAELIPDSIPKNSPPVPQQPEAPAAPYPGLLPGRKFYFLNGPQFVTYPQLGAPIQPTFRYPSVLGGYPQQFYIFGQPTVQAQPGQTVFLVNDPTSQYLRSNQVQKLDVPPLGFLRNAPSVSSSNDEEEKQNVQNENENEVKIEGRIDTEESKEESSEAVPEKPENPEPNDKDFTKFLKSPALKKAEIENDAVIIEADESAAPKKEEIVHEDLKSVPPQAKSAPNAVAIAGEGGSAQSSPKGSAVAGPAGLAVSSPTATALAGDYTKVTNKSK